MENIGQSQTKMRFLRTSVIRMFDELKMQDSIVKMNELVEILEELKETFPNQMVAGFLYELMTQLVDEETLYELVLLRDKGNKDDC